MSEIAKARPAVPVMLDKERHLLLNLNAMVDFEAAAGRSLFGLDVGGLGAKELRALLWACLRHEDKALTLETVGELITPANMAEIASSLSTAFQNAMPEPGETANPS